MIAPFSCNSPSVGKILVVDDEQSLREFLSICLKRAGHAVMTAKSGAEALEAVAASPFDIVVTDLRMPGDIDGIALLTKIRSGTARSAAAIVPEVILVTAYATKETALAAMKQGAYDYLTKPFQVDHLREIVIRCLESKGLLRMTEAALRESLGATIREKRKSLGFTLSNMSERTGVSLGYLSQIELGKNSASIETLYRISLALGIKMSDLFAAVQRQ